MALPELLKARVEQQLAAYCERKVPIQARHQVRLEHEIRGTTVTLTEARAPFDGSERWTQTPIAQCRFDPETKLWSLYCRDRNIRWHPYRYAEPARDIGALLHALDVDTTGIFWG